MTDDPVLLTIGDFARAVGLSASALRHYDDCGLLVPARTDAATGYRYYTPALEQRARLVATMRDVGIPIEAMRRVLDGSTDDARTVLDDLTRDRDAAAARTREAIDDVLAALDVSRRVGVVRLRVDGPALAAALRQVLPAADRVPSSALGVVLLDARGSELDVVATNRHWMACRTLLGQAQAEAEVSGEARVTVPQGAVAALADQLDATDDATVVIGDGRLSVESGDDLDPVPTGERPFPAHRLVLAALKVATTTVVVDREALVGAVTRAGRSVVDVACDDGGLLVAGTPVEAVVRGGPVAMRFRSALLLRAAASCVGPRVRLRLADADRPVLLGSPDQPGYVALVMPTLEPSTRDGRA